MLAYYLFVAALVVIFGTMLFAMVSMLWWLAARGIPQLRKNQAAAQKQPFFILRWAFLSIYVTVFLLPALWSSHAFVSPQTRALLTHSFFVLFLVDVLVMGCTAAVWTILSNRATIAEMNAPDEPLLSVRMPPPENNWLVPERP